MVIQINGKGFALNSSMVYAGDPSNKDEVAAFQKIKDAHVIMEEEFKDPKNIGEFVLLMATVENPFLEYNHVRGRTFE